jgi:hypothetical protein
MCSVGGKLSSRRWNADFQPVTHDLNASCTRLELQSTRRGKCPSRLPTIEPTELGTYLRTDVDFIHARSTYS